LLPLTEIYGELNFKYNYKPVQVRIRAAPKKMK